MIRAVMRMLYYFGAALVLCVPALLWTAVSGIFEPGPQHHLMVGLVTAVLLVATHTLLIMFMIVTGRVLKAAMASRPLSGDFLEELNDFFARRSAYPAAVFGAFFTVATAVLGYTQRGFDWTPIVHMTAGLLTVGFNFWAFSVEYRTLAQNQVLLDKVALELDRLDREHPEDIPAPEEEIDALTLERWGMLLAISSWMPYAYWAMVEHRGDFSKTSLHPWIEASAVGVVMWFLARRESGDAGDADAKTSSEQ